MDDWSQAWLETVEQVAKDFEDFCTEIGQVVEAIAAELQAELARDLDRWLDHWFGEDWLNDDWFETASFYLDLDETSATADAPFAKRLPASASHQPACIGCHHYHGYVYGGNLLVCGMHPYGWSGEVCPDWETRASDDSGRALT